MQPIPAQHYPEMDLMRAFAILGVIGIHVAGAFPAMSLSGLAYLYMSADAFSNFAVPCFVLISGFVLYNKYSGEFDLREFYRRRLRTVVPPYLVFSAVGLAVTWLVAWRANTPSGLDAVDIVKKLATGMSYFHLWFFVVIIELYLLYPVILALYKRARAVRWGAGALLVGSFLLLIAYLVMKDLEITAYLLVPFTGYLFYFVLGMHFRSLYGRVREREWSFGWSVPVFLVLLVGTLAGVVYYLDWYFLEDLVPNDAANRAVFAGAWASVTGVAFAVTSLFLVLYLARHLARRGKESTPALAWIGANSFGIYLVEAFVLTGLIFAGRVVGFTPENILYLPVTFALSLGLSCAAVAVINRLPYHRYIVGR